MQLRPLPQDKARTGEVFLATTIRVVAVNPEQADRTVLLHSYITGESAMDFNILLDT